MTWKQKRPAGVLVSTESAKLTKLMPCASKLLTRSTSCLTLLRGPRKSVQSAWELQLTECLGEGRWWLVVEGAVWSQVIAGPAPVGIQHPGFQDAVENLPGEEFIVGSAVEAFDVGVCQGGPGSM